MPHVRLFDCAKSPRSFKLLTAGLPPSLLCATSPFCALVFLKCFKHGTLFALLLPPPLFDNCTNSSKQLHISSAIYCDQLLCRCGLDSRLNTNNSMVLQLHDLAAPLAPAQWSPGRCARRECRRRDDRYAFCTSGSFLLLTISRQWQQLWFRTARGLFYVGCRDVAQFRHLSCVLVSILQWISRKLCIQQRLYQYYFLYFYHDIEYVLSHKHTHCNSKTQPQHWRWNRYRCCDTHLCDRHVGCCFLLLALEAVQDGDKRAWRRGRGIPEAGVGGKWGKALWVGGVPWLAGEWDRETWDGRALSWWMGRQMRILRVWRKDEG